MSSKHSSLGNRMKAYEYVTRTYLMRRTPVIIRLDGKAFHTFCKKINVERDASMHSGPFSHKLHTVMTKTTEALVANIQNAKIAYTQSDEITILLTDWSTLQTDQWFGGNIQKIASVSASMATAYFNHFFSQEFPTLTSWKDLAFFDSRVFNVPKEDVANMFVWRQQDCTRNSINMLGQHYFSHAELQGKNINQVQDMLMLEKNINWNNLDTWKKRGTCVSRRGIVADKEIPIFTQDRMYIERHLHEADNSKAVEALLNVDMDKAMVTPTAGIPIYGTDPMYPGLVMEFYANGDKRYGKIENGQFIETLIK